MGKIVVLAGSPRKNGNTDRLVEAFESYNNRPVVVSVVDINNRQAAVRNVQVLAGLDV